MTKQKSECCGADVYYAVWWGSQLCKCSKCHKPCTVRKEERDEPKNS